MSRRRKASTEPPLAAFAADVQRGAVLLAVALAPLVYAPEALGPFSVPKLVLILVAAVAIVAAQVMRTIVFGVIRLPWDRTAAVVGSLVVAFVVAAGVAEWRMTALLGQHGRDSGLLLYLSCLVAFMVVWLRFDKQWLRSVCIAVLVGASLVGAVAFLQRIGSGLVPFQVAEVSTGHNGTMANPNFASGYVGLALPLLVWGASTYRRTTSRVLIALAAVMCCAGLYASDSVQGPIAATAGGIVTGVLLVLRARPATRRVAVPGLLAVTAAGAIVLIAGILGHGPLAVLGREASFAIRLWYWETGLAMWEANPLLGVGLDQYAGWYRTYRPVESVIGTPVNLTNDAAHNVPLMMLAGGGLLLAAAYALFVMRAGWDVVKAARQPEQAHAVVSALAGGWAAYHVQSLVSIDVPPLALAHFVLAGGVLAATSGPPQRRAWAFPWNTAGSRRPTPAWRWAGVGIGAAILIVGGFLSLRPLRADVAAGRGRNLLQRERPAEAALAFEDAVRILPSRGVYHRQHGIALFQADMTEPAAAAFEQAAALEPRDLEALVWNGRLAAIRNDFDAADQWYERALAVEPLHPHLKLEIARLAASRGDIAEARRLLQEGFAVSPDDYELHAFEQTLPDASSS